MKTGLAVRSSQAVVVGKAIVRFDANRTIREENTIYLHESCRANFCLLAGGQQFLTLGESHSFPVCWFGGTDEEPFLTALHPTAFQIFKNQGEQAFYASLKPHANLSLENVFGVQTVRQGDIFATPVLMTGAEFLTAFSRRVAYKTRYGLDRLETEVLTPPTAVGFEGFRVLNTRHAIFEGNYTEEIAPILGFDYRVGRKDDHMVRPCALAHGWLKAPDHTSVFLKTVHLLTQMELLISYEPAFVAKMD